MKIGTIASVTLIAFSAGLAGLNFAANRHAKKVAAKKAAEALAPDIQEKVLNAQKRCELYKEVVANEKKAFEQQVKSWKNSNEFDIRKAEIINSTKSGLDEFKDSIGYSDKLDALNDAFDAGIEAFKNTISYDEEKAKLEAAITEAKAHYDQQKLAFDLAGDDIAEETMKLRHAAEESMTKKVKEAKDKIAALDNQLKDETARLTQKKLADVRVLEEKVSKEQIRLNKKTDKDLEKLNAELSRAEEDIQKKLRKARTEEEKLAFVNHENDLNVLREEKALIKTGTEDILGATPANVRLADFFRAKKVPKFVVRIVGFIPVICIAIIGGEYWHFLGKVLRAM